MIPSAIPAWSAALEKLEKERNMLKSQILKKEASGRSANIALSLVSKIPSKLWTMIDPVLRRDLENCGARLSADTSQGSATFVSMTHVLLARARLRKIRGVKEREHVWCPWSMARHEGLKTENEERVRCRHSSKDCEFLCEEILTHEDLRTVLRVPHGPIEGITRETLGFDSVGVERFHPNAL